MNRPVNDIEISAEQLNQAVETYLNEHVFRQPIKVTAVKARYDEKGTATIELGDPEPAPTFEKMPPP